MSSTISLNLGSENTLLFAIGGKGDFTAQVSITRVVSASPSAFNGVTLPMTEIVMPANHSRVFIAKYTPVDVGEYIISYAASNSAGERAIAMQRGIASSTGGGGTSASTTFGVGL